MERKIFHGKITPNEIASALIGEFNQGNLRAQTVGSGAKLVVQVGTRPGAASGGQTALTVSLQKIDDGVIVELGQQAWLGVAASLGASALAAIKNPFNLLGRLDDIAQDIENLQISERIWKVISKTVSTAGASTELSEKLKRLTCEYCQCANPVGEAACVACGAPLGAIHPTTCRKCGFVLQPKTQICPNCRQPVAK